MIPARIESAVQTFTHEGMGLRVFLQRNEPWFVAADVCAALTIANPRDAIQALDEDERGVSVFPTPSGEQSLNLISESGLYTLILRSRKPQARPFRRWVTHEVLPAIRKTGGYTPQPALSDLQAQMAEMRSFLESKAVKVKLSPKAASELVTAELGIAMAHDCLGKILVEVHRFMGRYGVKSLVHPGRIPE